jgi:hypothetical protein
MIIVELNGGLGNQLFQYAAGRSLAHRNNCELFLNTDQLDVIQREQTKRYFELDNFNHTGKILRKKMKLPIILKFVPWFSNFIGSLKVFVENKNNFNIEFLKLSGNIYLVGYWQSYKYFEDISHIIYNELNPSVRLSDYSRNLCNDIINSTQNTIALHVRRGDYVSNKSAASYHGTMGNNYYRKSIEYIFSRLESVKIYVFSDDPLWCKLNLPLEGIDSSVVNGNSGKDSWQDMIIMSHCKHHIIANSSFSWWGAWLADQRNQDFNRIVIAPIQWFSNSTDNNTADRFPAHWVTL